MDTHFWCSLSFQSKLNVSYETFPYFISVLVQYSLPLLPFYLKVAVVVHSKRTHNANSVHCCLLPLKVYQDLLLFIFLSPFFFVPSLANAELPGKSNSCVASTFRSWPFVRCSIFVVRCWRSWAGNMMKMYPQQQQDIVTEEMKKGGGRRVKRRGKVSNYDICYSSPSVS